MTGGDEERVNGSEPVTPGDSGAAPSGELAALANLDEERLLGAMREGDPDALHAFFERFAPVLHRKAARMRIPQERREECIMEVLADATMRILEHRLPRVRSVGNYLVRALHNRVLNERKKARRDERRTATAAARGAPEDGGDDEGAVIAVMSEFAIRAARGEMAQDVGRSNASGDASNDAEGAWRAAVQRLGAVLQGEMTEEEDRIMAWLADRISQRDIAEWLGASYDAMRTRVSRLRAELAEATERHERSLPAPERVIVERIRSERAYRRAARKAPTKRSGKGRVPATSDDQGPPSDGGGSGKP
jgi:RNA polymerase sigma factor (sigma-70 family)